MTHSVVVRRGTCAALALAFAFAEAALPEAEPPADASTSRLADAIRTAIEKNPRLQASQAHVEAARDRVPQARSLPPPELQLGFQDVPIGRPSLSRDDFTMEKVGLRQALPPRGKRAAMVAASEAELDAARAEDRSARLMLAADVGEAFFSLAAIDHEIAILRESARRLDDSSADALELYRVGKGSQPDVLRAQLERTALDRRLAELAAGRWSAAASFRSLSGLPPDAEVGEIAESTPEMPVPGLEDLAAQAVDASPEIVAAQAAERGAAAAVKLAGLERRPDWMVEGYYARRQNFEDLIGVSVAIPLPFLRRERLSAIRAEKEAESRAATSGIDAARLRIRSEIGSAYAGLEKERELIRIDRGSVLPLAEATYQAAREAYAVGRVDFLTLLRAATDWTEYRIEAARAEAGIGSAVAALQRASGVALLPGTPEEGDGHAIP